MAASTSSSSTYDAYGRRDSAFSAVSDTSYRSDDMYQPRYERTVSDSSTTKRPLRLSNAHKRRVSSNSVTVQNDSVITIKPAGQAIEGATIDENWSFPPSIEYDTPFTAHSDVTCSCCKVENPSHAHDDDYPEKCWEHRICLPRGGWKKHLERVEHMNCPISNCSKSTSEFGTHEKFIKHFVKRHDEKCWYWGKKKNVFGSEKAVWLRWNGE